MVIASQRRRAARYSRGAISHPPTRHFRRFGLVSALKSASGRPPIARHPSAAGDDCPKNSVWTIWTVQKTALDWAQRTIFDATIVAKEAKKMRKWPFILAVAALVAGGATPASALLFNLD